MKNKLLQEIKELAVLHEPIISHSDLKLTWWFDARNIWHLFSSLFRLINTSGYIPAGIETCGWELANSINMALEALNKNDIQPYRIACILDRRTHPKLKIESLLKSEDLDMPYV